MDTSQHHGDTLHGQLRQRMQEHLSRYEAGVKELELPFYQGICEYIVNNFTQPEKCTLREMERELSIPYSRLKRFAKNLVSEGVLVQYPMGTIKPFVIANLSRALSNGYLKADLRRLRRWTKLPYFLPAQGLVANEWLTVQLSSFPKDLYPNLGMGGYLPISLCETTLYLAAMRQTCLVSTDAAASPDAKGETQDSQTQPQADCDARVTSLIKKWKEEYAKRGIMSEAEIGALFDEVRSRAASISAQNPWPTQWLPELGFLPLFVVPYAFTTALPSQKAKGIHDRHVLLKPAGIWSREIFFELDCNESPAVDEVIEAGRRVADKQLKYLMAFLKALLKDIEQMGVERYLAMVNETASVTRENLLFLVVATGYSCLISLEMGADEDLVRRATALSHDLQKALDGGYKGRREEGLSLEEWCLKRGSSA